MTTERTFHTDSRTWSNFQPSELVKLCGVPQGRWPIYVVKELLDNAVAVLEDVNHKSPMVRVTITKDYIGVGENGPGISDGILDKILDFDRFGGSNRHHKLPTRGAQGNAIMTLVGITSAWASDAAIQLYRPCGPALSLEVRLDKVRQEVEIERIEIGKPAPSEIRVPLPELPWKRSGSTFNDVMQVVRQFAWMNPHVTFMIKDQIASKMWAVPSLPESKPCLTGGHSCGAVTWFTQQEFVERLAADVRARPSFPMSKWIQEFAFTKHVKISLSTTVEEFAGHNNALMNAKAINIKMHIMSKSDLKKTDDPKFNPVGQDRLAEFLSKEMGADKEIPAEYHSLKGTFGGDGVGVPFLVEVCLVQMPEKVKRAPAPILAMNRTILYGSPNFKNLQWRDKVRGQWYSINGSLEGLSRAYQIDHGKTPAAVVIHVTCPSPGYSGYGKQQFDTTWLAEPLGKCFERVTLQVRKQRAGESRRTKVRTGPKITIREQMFDIIPPVLRDETKDQNGKTIPVLIRQLYYCVRPKYLARNPDKSELEYGTFCSYLADYEESVGRRVCLRDPRGTLFEPHSGRELRLGTASVENYKPKKWEGHTILFVEKENLANLMKTLKIGKRWDAIIVGSKGFAVEAIRDVLQKYKALLGGLVKIICLHDADPAGYMIGHDLANNLPRFTDNVDIQVIDVGLTIEEAQRMGLQDEPFVLKKHAWSMTKNMRQLTLRDPDGSVRPLIEPAAWDSFMPSMARGDSYPGWMSSPPRGRRVELNAIKPRNFRPWLETHLEKHGCRKVRPPDAIVDETLRHARKNAIQNEAGALFMRLMGDTVVFDVMKEIGVPAMDLDNVLKMKPEQHWHYLTERAAQSGADIGEAVERVMRRKMPGAFKK